MINKKSTVKLDRKKGQLKVFQPMHTTNKNAAKETQHRPTRESYQKISEEHTQTSRKQTRKIQNTCQSFLFYFI